MAYQEKLCRWLGLDVVASAELSGVAEHDIPVLIAAGKLTPPGDSAPNARRWFAAVEVMPLAGDADWLHKAKNEVSKHWRRKRKRCSQEGLTGRVAMGG